LRAFASMQAILDLNTEQSSTPPAVHFLPRRAADQNIEAEASRIFWTQVLTEADSLFSKLDPYWETVLRSN
jgi:hypothetical protein